MHGPAKRLNRAGGEGVGGLSHPLEHIGRPFLSPESGWLATIILLCASFIRSSAAVSLRPRIIAASRLVISGWNPPLGYWGAVVHGRCSERRARKGTHGKTRCVPHWETRYAAWHEGKHLVKRLS